jgi:hypothetical protein
LQFKWWGYCGGNISDDIHFPEFHIAEHKQNFEGMQNVIGDSVEMIMI